MEDYFRQFDHPDLSNLLPKNSKLILNTQHNILSLFSEGKLKVQQPLTPMENRLITKLLEAYPGYCANEVLLSIQNGASIQECQQLLLNASKQQKVQEVTTSLRAVLARCRKKLHPFGIDVATLLGRGSILEPLTDKVKIL